MTNILITGGAGFVGSQLGLELCNQGYNVTLLDNMSNGYKDNIRKNGKLFCKFINADIRKNNFEKYLNNIDVIIHLAAISSLPYCQESPIDAYSNNLSGVINVLEAARKKNIKRFIFASTSAVYEANSEKIFRENLKINPNLTYSLTKYNAEKVCVSYSLNYGMDIIICRFFNIYGEHADIHRKMPPFISYIAKEFFYNRRPVLFNNSNAKRDYIYIEDLNKILIKMVNSKKKFKAKIFNICSGKGYSVPDLYSKFLKISGKNLKPIYKNPMKYWDNFPKLFKYKPLSKTRIKKEVYKNSIGDNSLIVKEFKFKASTNIDEGIRKIYEYSLKSLSKK